MTAYEASDFVPASVCSFDPDDLQRKPCRKARKKPADQDKPSKPEKPAFSRIIQLCSLRDRSSAELQERLMKDGYSAEETQSALERARECNIVNNERFADSFVRCKVAAGKGERWIEAKLKKHGIDAATLPDWPCGYGLEDDVQLQRAVSFLESHPPRSKDQYSGAYRKLIQRGYSGQISNRAIRIWLGRCEEPPLGAWA